MQADRRLIQHVHHANQPRANLACQTDTLRLAAGEGLCGAGEGQVVQADVDQELQTVTDLFQYFFRNLRALAGEFQVVEEVHRVTDAHVGDGRQRRIFNVDVACFATQTGTVAAGARTVADELRQLLAHRAGFRLFIAALHVVQHAFKRMATHGRIATVVDVFEFNRLFAGAVKNGFLRGGIKAFPRGFNVEFVVFCQRLQHLEVIEVTTIPAANRATGQRQLRVLDNSVRIEILLHAQAVTGWACARWVVEREQAWLKLAHAVAANRAGEVGGEQQLFCFRVVHIGDHRRAAGELQCGFKRFRQTLRQVIAYFKAVNHHFDGVFLLQFQLWWIGQIADFAVDAGADIALACQVLQRFGVLALTFFNDRGQQHQALAFWLRQYVIDHLADGLRRQRHVVIWAARLAYAGI